MPERDPLNFFSPYERLPPGHENQLTRALLLVLRMSPLAHVEWLRLIAPERALSTLPEPSFSTQRRAVRADAGPAELVSVFLAPEKPLSGESGMVESDRGQVLDAVIDYGELVTVIENKVFEADDLQARQINLSGTGLQIFDGQSVVLVLWRDLLERLIALRERALVAGAEAALLDDFLTYVEDYFPDLGPFRALSLCAGVRSRIERRLRQVLGEATGTEAEGSPSGPRAATPAGTVAGRDAYLTAADDHVRLALYPADTLGQAFEFYRRADVVEGVRALDGEEGWSVKPNFHFGHTQRGFCWTTSELALDEYLRLWVERIESESSVSREEWDGYWGWLVEKGIARPEDRPEFDRNFTETARKTATPRPGLCIFRHWSLAEAEALDSRGELVPAVREAIEEALRAVGEPGLPDDGG
ncbi:MAG TPA: hypothetical protein VFT79_13360 [Solirubrobacterales bacterium]|nr:hypothetical protein [Solirubrobacterales bacterium]